MADYGCSSAANSGMLQSSADRNGHLILVEKD